MIFLNAERFIEEGIQSIVAQTYNRWELLLVDDGSTDGSPAIAQRYAAQYPERCVNLQRGSLNEGMSASRNLGISQARGKYWAFLDANDIWLPPKLEQQVVTMESHPRQSHLNVPPGERF